MCCHRKYESIFIYFIPIHVFKSNFTFYVVFEIQTCFWFVVLMRARQAIKNCITLIALQWYKLLGYVSCVENLILNASEAPKWQLAQSLINNSWAEKATFQEKLKLFLMPQILNRVRFIILNNSFNPLKFRTFLVFTINYKHLKEIIQRNHLLTDFSANWFYYCHLLRFYFFFTTFEALSQSKTILIQQNARHQSTKVDKINNSWWW